MAKLQTAPPPITGDPVAPDVVCQPRLIVPLSAI
jgi:hypothetical protein